MTRLARVDGVAEPLVLVAFDGKHFHFESARAFAPGQPLVAQVALSADEGALRFDLKALGSVKRQDGRFAVRARATTLSRAAKAALAQWFGPPPGADP